MAVSDVTSPARARFLTLLTAAALLSAAALAGWLWAAQGRYHSGRLSQSGYHVKSRGDSWFLRTVTSWTEDQTLYDGQAQIHFFATLLFDPLEEPGTRHLTRLDARVLLPADTWVDLIARHTDHGEVVFRVSRAAALPSGWYVFDGPRCVDHRPVDTSATLPLGTVDSIDRRADLKYYSAVYFNQARAVIDEAFDTRAAQIALTMRGASLEAWLNGQSVGAIDLTPLLASREWLAAGAAGLRGADLPPIRVDWMSLEGRSRGGEPFAVHETFDLPPLTLRQWIALAARPTVCFLAVAALAGGALLWLLPGLGPRRAMAPSIAALALIAAITAWAEQRRLINRGEEVAAWRAAEWAMLGLVHILAILRHRALLRCRFTTQSRLPSPPWLPALLIGGSVSVALATAVGLWSVRWPPQHPTLREIAPAHARPWSPTQPLHLPLTEGDDAAVALDAQWQVTLSDSAAALEIYLNHWTEPPANIPHWLALRLTPHGVGFVPSEGYEPTLRGPGLAVGTPHLVSVRLGDGRVEAIVRRDGAQGEVIASAAHSAPQREAGGVGVVGRAGSGTVRPLRGALAAVPRGEITQRTLRAACAGHPRRFLALISVSCLIAPLGWGVLVWVVGRAPARAVFGWAVAVAPVCFALALLLAWLERRGVLPAADWQFGVLFVAPALLAVLLWYLFWIANFEALRWRQLGSLVFLLALLAHTEWLARLSPRRDVWQARTRVGPIFRQFLFADTSAGLIWMNYTGDLSYEGKACPPVPAREERRVFCLGGSSTLGVGVDDPADTFPARLQEALRRGSGDPRWEVYNAGWIGYTALSDLLRWQREIRARHPEAVVLYVGGNDHLRTNRPAMHQSEVHAMIQRLNEPSLGSRFQRAAMNLRVLVGPVGIWRGLTRGHGQYVVNNPPADFESQIRALIAEAQADGVQVVLAPEVLADTLLHEPDVLEPHRQALRRLAAEFAVPLVDTAGAFRARRRDQLMTDFIHPNAEGNRLLADAIASALLSSAEAQAPTANSGSTGS